MKYNSGAAYPGRVDILDVHYQQVTLHQAELRSGCRGRAPWWEEALLCLCCSGMAALLWSIPY